MLKIHPLTIDDVWNDVGLPKVEDFGDYVQIIIHGVRADDQMSKEVPLELAELDVLIGQTFVVILGFTVYLMAMRENM